ncbi:MarR family winged helix-turn-helix transcriptional regulator [Hellea balneolensis]|uniref:MarR family winged helix-turn-helix transcriptional regulator n=1 Tax=Hellea balneolensis TaxID=287478 RepID=UPI00040BC311|nr:MarR family transcriptional regulator [Hellea balneolensis]
MSFSENPRENIAYEVRGTFRAFENALITALAKADISVGFFHILRLSWPEEGRKQKEVADLAFMTPSVASQQIKKMCKAGLLSRESAPDDDRKKIVKLTKEGLDKKNKLVSPIILIPVIASEGISDADMETATRVLHKLRLGLK